MTEPLAAPAFIPHLVVRRAADAIAYYGRVFGAVEDFRLTDPQGRLHAELLLEGARFMLADEYPEYGIFGPETYGGATSRMSLYVADVDRLAERALAAGGELEAPVRDEFYGDRVASFRDPFGHRWAFHTRREDLSPRVMQERLDALCAEQAGDGRERLPVIVRTDHVGVTARNVANTAKFYCDVLGFEQVQAEPRDAVTVKSHLVRLVISGSDPSDSVPSSWPRGDHLALAVHADDRTRLLERLEAKRVDKELQDGRVYVADPDGRVVELVFG